MTWIIILLVFVGLNLYSMLTDPNILNGVALIMCTIALTLKVLLKFDQIK